MTILAEGSVVRSARELIALVKKAEVGKSVLLEDLLEKIDCLAVLGDPRGVEITSVVWHHEQVTQGALYCCLPGQHFDGHDFAAKAIAKGAVALLCEHSVFPATATQSVHIYKKEDIGESIDPDVRSYVGENQEDVSAKDQGNSATDSIVQVVVEKGKTREAMAQAACTFFGNPATDLLMVGVTGTNGKTTTTFILKSIFESAGIPTGVIGTLDGARTTPEAPELQKVLSAYKEAGYKACVMEVTSHALAQDRVYGICFDMAIFTNLSQDHLDYHGSMDEYFKAKAKLFTTNMAKVGIVNIDNAYGRRLMERSEIKVIPYGLKDVDQLDIGPNVTTFVFDNYRVRLSLGGLFNVENALAAATAAKAYGISAKDIVAGISQASGVPGRFEQVESDNGVRVVVDFAHTPDALDKVLQAARSALQDPSARLTVVFGCGGDRDKGKRPVMGQVASVFADRIVLTSDNPRSEDPQSIIDQILAGINSSAAVELHVEADRQKAIEFALRTSKPGDLVLIAGKGHESTQQIGNMTVPFDDRKVVSQFLDADADPFSEPIVWPSTAAMFAKRAQYDSIDQTLLYRDSEQTP